MPTLSEKFNELAVLKAIEKRDQAQADDSKKRRKEYEAELYEQALEEKTFSIRTDVGSFNLKTTTYGTVSDREAFHEWCRENDLAEEFLKVEEESARVNELVRAKLETSEELPAGLSWYERRYISHTSNKED